MRTTRPALRADLEALRGAAILMVVAYHAGVTVLAGGFVGVDVFFVLSGFFTARLLIAEYATTGTVDLAAFYGKRALRLLPALLVVVLATLIAVWTLYAPIDRAAIATTARSVVSGTANDAFARSAINYFSATESPFLHTWSLAVEMQVSLFGPLLFLALASVGGWRAIGGESARRSAGLLRGVGIGLGVAGVLSLGAAVWMTRVQPSWAFFGSAARAWEFIVGALLALALPGGAGMPSGDAAATSRGTGWWLQGAGLLAIAVAALTYDRFLPYPGLAALLPVLGAAAILAGGTSGRGPLADGRASRVLGWFGGISYGWYLWHWPMLVTGTVLAPDIGTWGRLAWSAAAIVPAWVTMRLVERPARRAAREGAGARWWPAVALAGCALVALAAGGLRTDARRRMARADQRALLAARDDRMRHACWAGKGTVEASAASRTCVFGDRTATTTVALFGDSHAEHWLAAFDRLGRERGWRVVLFVKGGCPVADAPELLAARSMQRDRECARYREDAVRTMVAMRPALAVLSSFDEYVTRGADARAPDGGIAPEAWRRGLARTYARIAGAGVPVVALRGTPHPDFDVPGCLSRAVDGRPLARPCTYARDAALHLTARAALLTAVQEVAARGLPVRAVDMSDVVCPTPVCDVRQGGSVVFTDDNHLTATFTRASAGVLGARLDGAMAAMRRVR